MGDDDYDENPGTPCPHRILDDIGGAFAMGAIGGGLWNMVKGARNSPRGERMQGSISAIRARAPILGGAAAAAWTEDEREGEDAAPPRGRGLDTPPPSARRRRPPTSALSPPRQPIPVPSRRRRQLCSVGRALL